MRIEKAILDQIASNHPLKKLNISGKFIEDENVSELALALRKNTILEELDLCSNRIQNKGAEALVAALSKNITLKINDLSKKIVGAEEAKVLTVNTTLKILDLGENFIGDEGAAVLIREANLTSLSLYSNGILSIEAIAGALGTNKTLKKLDLSYNEISSGVEALAASLIVNETLTELELSFNKINSKGVKCFAESLIGNTTLTALRLDHNLIDHEGAEDLAKDLKAIKQITIRNQLSQFIADKIAKSFPSEVLAGVPEFGGAGASAGWDGAEVLMGGGGSASAAEEGVLAAEVFDPERRIEFSLEELSKITPEVALIALNKVLSKIGNTPIVLANIEEAILSNPSGEVFLDKVREGLMRPDTEIYESFKTDILKERYLVAVVASTAEGAPGVYPSSPTVEGGGGKRARILGS